MVREIVRDPVFLGRRCRPATAEDLSVAADLADTLEANRERCVGMAANMIGSDVRIIVFADGKDSTVMLDPEIIKRSGPYTTEEGCLSLDGVRQTKRYEMIKVRWRTPELKLRIKTFTGFTAQIIQHELDHCDGILI